ncbi:MAG: biopolymer transporter ExbD [Candidatus Hydrogenedentota bacterium]
MRVKKQKIEYIQLDITPLVDVVFQLLIFFLLASSFELSTGIKVELPESKSTETIKHQSECVITIKKDDKIYLNGLETPLIDLKYEIKKIMDSKGINRVIIQADRFVYYGRVVRIIDIVKELGIKNVGLPTKYIEEEVPTF